MENELEDGSLPWVAKELHKYVMDNCQLDQQKVSSALVDLGYREVVKASHFFRGLYHTPEQTETIEQFFTRHRDGDLLRMDCPQGCCERLGQAMDYIGGTIHLTRYLDGVWPEHRPETILNPENTPQAVYIVYEVTAPQGAILWSMEGLKDFAKLYTHDASIEPLREALDVYGHDHEIMLDFSEATLVNTYLYDSEQHEIEYNRDR